MEKRDSERIRKISEKVKQLRIEKGFSSYEKFALEYDIGRMSYWRVENANSNFTLKTLFRIIDIHGISVEDFFKGVQ